MLDVERFSSADDLMDHYAGVRARLTGGKPRMALPAPPKTITAPVTTGAFDLLARHPNLMNAAEFRAWSIAQGFHWFDVELPPPNRRMKADAIMATHAGLAGLTIGDLKGSRRSQIVSHCRQDAMLEIYEELNATPCEIGRYLNKDHTTVIYGIRTARERRRLRRFGR